MCDHRRSSRVLRRPRLPTRPAGLLRSTRSRGCRPGSDPRFAHPDSGPGGRTRTRHGGRRPSDTIGLPGGRWTARAAAGTAGRIACSLARLGSSENTTAACRESRNPRGADNGGPGSGRGQFDQRRVALRLIPAAEPPGRISRAGRVAVEVGRALAQCDELIRRESAALSPGGVHCWPPGRDWDHVPIGEPTAVLAGVALGGASVPEPHFLGALGMDELDCHIASFTSTPLLDPSSHVSSIAAGRVSFRLAGCVCSGGLGRVVGVRGRGRAGVPGRC